MKKLNVVKSVSGEKKKKNGEKRIFFSLLLCVCAVVLISSMFASNVNKETIDKNAVEVKKEEEVREIVSVNTNTDKEEKQQPVKKDEVIKEEPKVEIEAPKVEEEISAPATQSEITAITMPVDGEILKMFSESKPVYSKTMGDWRVHNGVDIKANIGQSVFACAKGVVEDVYDDKMMGMTVVINHGKIKSKYQNLSATNIIAKGKEVEEGETIGIVGDSADAEIADVPHLHFEVLEGNMQVNCENLFK